MCLYLVLQDQFSNYFHFAILQKYSAPKYKNGLNEDTSFHKETTNNIADNIADKNRGSLAIPVEHIAAIRIQKAFRVYKVIFALVPSSCFHGYAFVSVCILITFQFAL